MKEVIIRFDDLMLDEALEAVKNWHVFGVAYAPEDEDETIELNIELTSKNGKEAYTVTRKEEYDKND